MKKTDLRVKRTQLSLEKSLFKIIKNKDLNEISIRALTTEAMVSRQTFYAHYQSKEELYLSMASTFYNRLNNKVFEEKKRLAVESEQEVLALAGEYYQRCEKEIQVLFSINDKDLIIQSLGEPAKRMYSLLGIEIEEENEMLLTELIAGLTYTLIKSWLSRRNTINVEQAIKGMTRMLSMKGYN